ncbi:MAG: 4Fe-4S binding protein [Candidatus Cloacimonetes bacterium]|nr:4Fe-4S binding protein [Candidatus Cloacimonadota bacterium]
MLVAFACRSSSGGEYNVDRSACNGCGECVRVCPHDAIYMDADNKAMIDQSKCQQCGNCVLVCPQSAIH